MLGLTIFYVLVCYLFIILTLMLATLDTVTRWEPLHIILSPIWVKVTRIIWLSTEAIRASKNQLSYQIRLNSTLPTQHCFQLDVVICSLLIIGSPSTCVLLYNNWNKVSISQTRSQLWWLFHTLKEWALSPQTFTYVTLVAVVGLLLQEPSSACYIMQILHTQIHRDWTNILS